MTVYDTCHDNMCRSQCGDMQLLFLTKATKKSLNNSLNKLVGLNKSIMKRENLATARSMFRIRIQKKDYKRRAALSNETQQFSSQFLI